MMGFANQGSSDRYWRLFFFFTGAAGLMGGVYHGFLANQGTIANVGWAAIMLGLAFAFSYLLAATVSSVLGDERARPFLWIRVISLSVFFVVAVLGYAGIPTLMMTAGLSMAIVAVLWMYAWRLNLPAAGLVVAAMLASGLAGALRGGQVHLTLGGLELDPDSFYHLAQMPGIVALAIALRKRRSMLSEAALTPLLSEERSPTGNSPY